jgi:hypothetical protein
MVKERRTFVSELLLFLRDAGQRRLTLYIEHVVSPLFAFVARFFFFVIITPIHGSSTAIFCIVPRLATPTLLPTPSPDAMMLPWRRSRNCTPRTRDIRNRGVVHCVRAFGMELGHHAPQSRSQVVQETLRRGDRGALVFDVAEEFPGRVGGCGVGY